MGPNEPPPQTPARKPEWVRVLEEDADVDDDVADLLKGTGGDPDKIRAKMQQQLSRKDMFIEGMGNERPPAVAFREINPFNLWVWLQFIDGTPGKREQDLLQAVLQAWFMVGKLGGYNSQNMQVFYNAGDDQSFFDYSRDELESSQGSYLHDLSELQVQGNWARFRIDMGTCDELALDVMLNALVGFSKDVAGIANVCVGGANSNWPVPDIPDDMDEPTPDIDPMRMPEGVDEELEMLGELEEELERQGGKGKGKTVPDEGRLWGSGLMRKYSQNEYKQAYKSDR